MIDLRDAGNIEDDYLFEFRLQPFCEVVADHLYPPLVEASYQGHDADFIGQWDQGGGKCIDVDGWGSLGVGFFFTIVNPL